MSEGAACYQSAETNLAGYHDRLARITGGYSTAVSGKCQQVLPCPGGITFSDDKLQNSQHLDCLRMTSLWIALLLQMSRYGTRYQSENEYRGSPPIQRKSTPLNIVPTIIFDSDPRDSFFVDRHNLVDCYLIVREHPTSSSIQSAYYSNLQMFDRRIISSYKFVTTEWWLPMQSDYYYDVMLIL